QIRIFGQRLGRMTERLISMNGINTSNAMAAIPMASAVASAGTVRRDCNTQEYNRKLTVVQSLRWLVVTLAMLPLLVLFAPIIIAGIGALAVLYRSFLFIFPEEVLTRHPH